ncbi:pirin family protein [Telluria aromaticivorans]|uniref:Pirin family protein n=1 Tax=Telluria aromaticivorans TaxID=2725995 RepID=A0A7Y2K2K8_9BURK|nr:pirin family protein [Telluria aromaticivorans]NNG25475.1 pirin family protein [Telluria aromaticivorans]
MSQFNSNDIAAATTPRRITHRTRGFFHGPITRLMSPGDLGQTLKPFVFLDLFELDLHDSRTQMPIHPHSGLATITVITEGDLRFDDPADVSGYIGFGGFEWMRAGGGVWHGKEMSAGNSPTVQGFQLWIALGPELELEAVDSQYVEAQSVPTTGPAHVILGSYDGMRSPARSPDGITYLLLRLPVGSQWTFVPPAQQTVAWLAVARGELEGDIGAREGEMLLFEQSEQAFKVQASPNGEAVIVIGSAVPHAHELHLGRYSVHTSAESLVTGEANIERLRTLLVEAGDRRQQGGSVPVFKG